MRNEVFYRASSEKDLSELLPIITQRARKGLEGGPMDVVLRRPSKNRLQEEKYHAMIGDIHHQCFRANTPEGVKAVLVNQFALEMEEQGTPLANPGEKVWDWKSEVAVYVRPSTTKFRKYEAAQFIEFLYATGVDLGVSWSEKALKAYESYKEARAA
tara:strand:+ start:376 stop:846 length:471 start_codon:yes stop_codon:yes gene_type:complete